MAQEVLLPKLGLTMEEGTIVEWVAKTGDVVSNGDVLLRISTDKVDAEVEAEGSGRFQPVADEGATLPPGALIAWLLEGDEQPPDAPSSAGVAALQSPAADDVGELQLTAPERSGPVHRDGRVLASPNARRVAAEHSVDLETLRGTGPGGRIVSEDVEEALAHAAAQPAAAPAPAAQAHRAGTVVSPLVRRDAAASGVDLSRLRGSGLGGRIRRADVTAAAAGIPPEAAVPAHAAVPAP